MEPLNETIVVTVTDYSGTTTPDKNGKMSVMLQCLAGKMPNRNVISGTVAERQGFEVGKTYLAQVREQGFDKVFGRSFTFIRVAELHEDKIVDAIQKLGKPEIIYIDRPEGFEDVYKRQGDAVESLQTKRAKEGQFIPVNRTRTSHKTADIVRAGTTVTESTEYQNLTEEDLKKGRTKADLNK